MFKIIFLVIIILAIHDSSAAQVHPDWLARTDSVEARGIAVDRNGNVYVSGNVFRGSSAYNIALVKYNPSGIQQWMREFNGIGDDADFPTAIALDTSGNIFVTGYSFRGPALLNFEIVTIKFAPNGDSLWVRRYNGSGALDDRSTALAVDSAGNAYVGGYIDNISLGNVYGEDYITIKYSPDGTQLWASPLDLVSGSVTALAVDPTGNVYVTGVGADASSTSSEFMTVKYSAGGAPLWVKHYNPPGTESDEGRGIAVDDSGNVYVTGRSTGAVSYDYATIKYNAAGDEQWVRRYDGPADANDSPIGIVVDANRNVYVTGKTTESGSFILTDFLTIKYNTAGDSLWVKRYNGPGGSVDEPSDIAIDAQAGIYVTGRSIGAGFSGYSDYATIKYGTDGDSLWLRRHNPADLDDVPVAVDLDRYGNVYVTGMEQTSFTSFGSATFKYSQPIAQSLGIPEEGTGSTTPFGNTFFTFIGDVTGSDSVTILYYESPPLPGTLPTGIIRISGSYWRALNDGMVFTNGFVLVRTEDLFGVTAGGCGACLVWLKRDNPGDPWQNIGGSFNGTLTLGTLISIIPFDSFSEFAIGSTDTLTLSLPDDPLPFTYGLAQNYPNPFNPVTKISFGIGTRGMVQLRVYDVLGREAATLVDEEMSPGSYTRTFDATGLAGGVYFYRLQAGDLVRTKKLLLIR